MRHRFALLLLLLTVTAGSRGDSWPAPRMNHVFSDDGSWFVKIIPGESVGESEGFSGSPKGRWARAELYRQAQRSYRLVAEVPLRNPVAPVDVLVSNGGSFITFDNWHNVGYGEVVAIYGPNGKLTRSYKLTDLFAAEEIAALKTSVSSRWWRCRPWGFSDPARQTAVYVTESRGGQFLFELTSGSHRYLPGQARCNS